MRIGAVVFGAISGMLLLFLLLGLLLPGTWTAEAEILLPAPPSDVFPHLEDLSAWESWTPFPEGNREAFGPPRGAGAGLRWEDPQYGRGEVRILESLEDRVVTYQVLIEGGTLRVTGTLSLLPEDGDTRLRWVEEGDFGWNPLMGYTARGMAESQGAAMAASLSRLGELLVDPDPR